MIDPSGTTKSKQTAQAKVLAVPKKPLRIIIFAKAPLAGLAKTRLIPALGEQGAAQLARQLLIHSVEQALAAKVGAVELCVTPCMQHSVWGTMQLSNKLQWSSQGGGNLGDRLARTARQNIVNGEAVLLMGTDCPALTAERIAAAAHALSTHDSCLVPASDGGYVLLGLNYHLPSVFIDMPWSTAAVARLTREQIFKQGYTLQEFAALHDIDEPEDLHYLPKQLKAALRKVTN